jgi:hypothetical protein
MKVQTHYLLTCIRFVHKGPPRAVLVGMSTPEPALGKQPTRSGGPAPFIASSLTIVMRVLQGVGVVSASREGRRRRCRWRSGCHFFVVGIALTVIQAVCWSWVV